MPRRSLHQVVAAALAVLVGVLAPSAAMAGPASLRIEHVDRTHFPKVAVTVVGPNANALAQLQLFENGQLAAKVHLPDPKAAAAIALAIDTSDSMHGRPLRDATAAGAAFVRRQPSNDLLAVYGFDNHPYVVSTFGLGAGDAVTGLGKLSTGGPVGTTVYGAIAQIAADFRHTNAARRVLILLTDGQSFHDSTTLDAAIAAARRTHVTVYPVAIVTPLLKRAALEDVARGTGGQLSLAQNPGQLKQIYQAISRTLGDTFTLTYHSLVAPGSPITLRVTAPGARPATIRTQAPGKAPAVHANSGRGLVLPTSTTSLIAIVVGGMVALMLVCVIAVRIRSPFG